MPVDFTLKESGSLHSFYANKDYSLFGVIGNPISHSKSPELHNQWLKLSGLSSKAQYIKINITNPADLKEIILTMPKMGFVGCNITVPFKEEVFNIISELEEQGLARIETIAKNLKAVNCVFFNSKTNIIEAYNTDCKGFTESIKALNFTRVLILGAGGSSKAIVSGLISLINTNTESLSIANRTYQNAKNIELQFSNPFLTSIKFEEIKIQDYDLIINATSLGLRAGEYPDIDYNKISKSALCYDLIYPKDSPESLTPFLQKCLDSGIDRQQLCNGYTMLIGQAAESYKIWTGHEVIF